MSLNRGGNTLITMRVLVKGSRGAADFLTSLENVSPGDALVIDTGWTMEMVDLDELPSNLLEWEDEDSDEEDEQLEMFEEGG